MPLKLASDEADLYMLKNNNTPFSALGAVPLKLASDEANLYMLKNNNTPFSTLGAPKETFCFCKSDSLLLLPKLTSKEAENFYKKFEK